MLKVFGLWMLFFGGAASVITLCAEPGTEPQQKTASTPTPMNDHLAGTWSGLMLDAEGRRARLEMRLDQNDSELKGEIEISLISDEKIESSRGRVTGKVSDRGNVTLGYTLEGPGGRIAAEFNGQYLQTEFHAKATLYGTYQVRDARAETLSAGVSIMWLYADKQ